MRRICVFLGITFLALALPLAVGAINFGGISARPANPTTTDERTASWFIYALPGGGTKNDALLVTNNTDNKLTLDVYPADSTPTSGNGFALKQQSEKMTDLGKWIKLSTTLVTLAPHQEISVPFTINVPNETAPGLYAGGVMIAERVAADKTKGMKIATRIGVRVYVTVVPRVAATAKQKTLFPSAAAVAALALVARLVARKKKKH